MAEFKQVDESFDWQTSLKLWVCHNAYDYDEAINQLVAIMYLQFSTPTAYDIHKEEIKTVIRDGLPAHAKHIISCYNRFISNEIQLNLEDAGNLKTTYGNLDAKVNRLHLR